MMGDVKQELASLKTNFKGARILVTRPRHQARQLCDLITQQHGYAVQFPTLEIEALTVNDEIGRKLAMLENYHWLIFVSVNAVDYAVKANSGKIDPFRLSHIAAVGKATAKALQKLGLTVDLLPDQGFNSEALLEMPVLQDMQGLRCLIVRGQGGREKLAETLRYRGARVEYLEIYKRVKPETNNNVLAGMLKQNHLAAVTITSCEALQNLLQMLDEQSAALLLFVPLVVISHRIRQKAEQLGFKRIAVTENPADTAILKTLTTVINGENSGRSN